MLIPRYSLRWLLGLTTFSAGVSLVLSYAIRGAPWAIGVAAGLWSLVIVALVYVAAFLAAWLIAQVLAVARNRSSETPGDSPFAAATPGDSSFGDRYGAAQPIADSPPPITG